MFDIITITCGRTLYLNRLLKSIDSQDTSLINKHYIVFQNESYNLDAFTGVGLEYFAKIEPIIINGVKSVGQVLNETSEKLTSPYMVKLDDDAIIRSQDFFKHASEITQLVPNSTFSPFPVGLINNLGGIQSSNRQVKYGSDTDTYYTLRRVHHVGGFARFTPSRALKAARFSDSHNEDTEFSSFCARNGIDMFYLENALIIEHQESTLGQHARYGEDYFKGRF